MTPDNSVIKVTGFGLDDQSLISRRPVTDSGVHPTYIQWVSAMKRRHQRVAYHLHVVSRLRMHVALTQFPVHLHGMGQLNL
jgi:hypothetical protein